MKQRIWRVFFYNDEHMLVDKLLLVDYSETEARSIAEKFMGSKGCCEYVIRLVA